MESMRHVCETVSEMRALGAVLARSARAGDVFALVGGLGVGKTELVRGFVEHLMPGAAVRSPTFSLVNTYPAARFPVHHFDFYRLCQAAELIEIGFSEYLMPDAVCLIEWADMFPEVIPPRVIRVSITDDSGAARVVSITPPDVP